MSGWAYRCHPCVEGEADWFVSQLDVEKLSPDARIVRVKVGTYWKCAHRSRTVSRSPGVIVGLFSSCLTASSGHPPAKCATVAHQIATSRRLSYQHQPQQVSEIRKLGEACSETSATRDLQDQQRGAVSGGTWDYHPLPPHGCKADAGSCAAGTSDVPNAFPGGRSRPRRKPSTFRSHYGVG